MSIKPWRLRWRLKHPHPSGQCVWTNDYRSESAARHEGQRLWDAGRCVSITLTNLNAKATQAAIAAEWPPRGQRGNLQP